MGRLDLPDKYRDEDYRDEDLYERILSQPIPDEFLDDLGRAPIRHEALIDALPTSVMNPGSVTHKQRELLQALACGLTISDYARERGVTRDTAKTMMLRIRWKLNARTPMEAVAIAIRRGLI